MMQMQLYRVIGSSHEAQALKQLSGIAHVVCLRRRMHLHHCRPMVYAVRPECEAQNDCRVAVGAMRRKVAIEVERGRGSRRQKVMPSGIGRTQGVLARDGAVRVVRLRQRQVGRAVGRGSGLCPGCVPGTDREFAPRICTLKCDLCTRRLLSIIAGRTVAGDHGWCKRGDPIGKRTPPSTSF